MDGSLVCSQIVQQSVRLGQQVSCHSWLRYCTEKNTLDPLPAARVRRWTTALERACWIGWPSTIAAGADERGYFNWTPVDCFDVE
jgi:hypothetical protein